MHPDTKELMSVDSFTANVVQAMGKEAGVYRLHEIHRKLINGVSA